MNAPSPTSTIPPWLPPQLHDGYREIAAERGEEEAATWGRQAKRGRVLEWTPDQVEHLRRRFEDGASATTIAAEIGFGATRNAVIGKLHRLGIRRGDESATAPAVAFDWTEPRLDMLRRLWERNMPPVEIAARIGVSAAAVRRMAARLGLAPRGSGALRASRGIGGQAPAGGRPSLSGPPAAPVVAIATAIPPKRETATVTAPGDGVAILEVGEHQCSWIIAGEREHARCCGAQRQRRTIFKLCEAHLAASINPQSGRRG